VDYLESILPEIKQFLQIRLNLELHPSKVSIKKLAQGIDFLGYIILPRHIVLRKKTKKRMFSRLFEKQQLLEKGLLLESHLEQSLQSYLGLLKHCNGYDLQNILRNNFSL
jgi:RNA-directed DNA polymerase